MGNFSADKIRNITLLGHQGSGKTALAEAILYCTKTIERMGRATDGNTTMDFDPEEIKRQISINATVAACEYKDSKIIIIDTPGDFDFLGEEMSGIRVADSGIVLISAKGGTSVGSEKAIRLLNKKNVPFLFFVNRMDEPNADFDGVIERMRNRYGPSVIPLSLPIMEDGKMMGIVDVMNRKAFSLDAKTGATKEIPLPDSFNARIDELQDAVNEVVAESDDALMEKYFAGEPFTEDEFRHGVHAGFRTQRLHPIYCGSAYMNWGVDFLLNCISKDTPPAGRKPVLMGTLPDGSEIEVECKVEDPLAAFVFKTIADPFVGRISIFKVNAGEIKANSVVYNATKGKEERISNLFFMVGKKQIPTDKVTAGDIGCAAKLAITQTNDTLCDKSRIIEMPKISFPTPCLSMSISPLKKGEEDKIMGGLTKLSDEDPVFKVETNPETKQMVISGLGESEIKVLISKLKAKYNVDAELGAPKVPYREAIRKKVKVQGKHKKQSGGHGQYGDVWIEFEPSDSEELIFDEKVFGGAVPKNFFPAVQKGLEEAVKKGVLAGYPVVNLKATLVDGSYHDVDSSEMAFKIAASLAFKAGMEQGNPMLLEPYSTVGVHIPEDKQGDIMGDMSKRRGRIMGYGTDEDGATVVSCEVPTAEMANYATDLKSMTQGRGWYTIEHVRYEMAPPEVAEKVIAESKAEEE
ncbi:MAG: elongation factor G [Clostridiales bacterium]|nr:elongation factor G [Clostridiales bacterium]